MPIPRGCLPKSDFSRDFQSAVHTVFFGTPEPEKQFETPNPFSLRPSLLEHPFYSLLQGVDEVVKLHLSFPSLDNGTLVDQQLPSYWSTPIMGRFLSFRTTGLFRNDTKGYR
ncbi:hypothetical protein AVEN_118875-1 [Araneus ventricosus]|uniref:Uncharacterized protein n=1 Tax=Araneus ventricosus TaxID=182803 RepID=A0A4Y2J3F1_ARAVE|nr:hypothetical protein AVEN_118875-1 [Araneus ventricosus]